MFLGFPPLCLRVSFAIALVLICQASAAPQEITRDPRYPAHWWTPVVDPKKPDWEILPQEAAPGEVILFEAKRTRLAFEFCADAIPLSRKTLREFGRPVANDEVSRKR